MEENNNLQTCQCCNNSKESTITNREKCLIELAFQFAIRDTGSVKNSIIAAKSEGITSEDIKELCSIVAENSKEVILSMIKDKKEIKKSGCCV